MIVFRLGTPEGGDTLVLADAANAARVHALDGSPRANAWQPPKARIGGPHGERSRNQPFVGYFHLLTVREDVAIELAALWLAHGEFLELDIEGRGPRYFIYNVRSVDALDLARSKVDVTEDGEITFVNSHVFRGADIGDNDLFRLPTAFSYVYATDRFVNAYARSKVRGLTCHRVWADFDDQPQDATRGGPAGDLLPGKIR